MRHVSIDTDEAVRLDITASKSRTFELKINLHRPLTGGLFELEVRDGGGVLVLEFDLNNGLTIDGEKLVLHKSHTAMNVPTGIFLYDLIDKADSNRYNLAKGYFTIKPSVTL